MEETRRLADFATSLRFKDIPADSVATAKRVLLDGLGCLIAGSRGDMGQAIAEVMARQGGAEQSTVLASGKKTSVRDAAFANAMALYSVGLNDIHKPSGSHPGGCIIPVIVSLGEWLDASGVEMLVAMVAGYEINGRVGRAVKTGHRARGFHPTGTCGTFGAAAAAARLQNCSTEQMLNILGIAGSQASGLYEFHHTGSTTMIYHAGRAAQNGIEAVLMAEAGVTGPVTVLEGRQGFFAAMSSETKLSEIDKGLGSRFMVDETSLRPHFGCNSTKATSSALEGLFKSGRCSPGDVEHLEISLNPLPARDNDIPKAENLLAARLSIQFNAALVLGTGDVLVRDLEMSDLADPRIVTQIGKVTLRADENLPRYACSILVSLKDGTTLECQDGGKHGDPDDPLLWDDVVEKFMKMTETTAAPDLARKVVHRVLNLEESSGRALVADLRESLG